MVSAATDLQIRIIAKDEASKVLKDTGDSAGGLGKALGDVGKIATGFLAANVIEGGIGKLTGFLSESAAAAKESAAIQAQLEAALKSTGGAAGETLGALNEMSAALQKQTNFDDEAIGGAQALLLTFTSIGKDVFPDATKTVLDMSQALGQDLKSSSIQLGKALNDPTQGMTALRRVGVSFSTDQENVIKKMQETGNLAGAQKLILAELNKEFGGSAEAAVKADGGVTQLKNRMNDLQETIGAKLIPIQAKFKEAQVVLLDLLVSKGIPAFESIAKVIQPIGKYLLEVVRGGDPLNDFLVDIDPRFQSLAKTLGNIVVVIQTDLIPAFKVGFQTILDAARPAFDFVVANKPVMVGAIAAIGLAILLALGPGALAIAALLAIPTIVGLIKTHWDELKAKTDEVWNSIPGPIRTALDFIRDNVQTRIDGIKQIFEGLVTVLKGVVDLVVDLFHGRWKDAWDDLKTIASGVIDIFIGYVKEQFGNIPSILLGLVTEAANAGLSLGKAIANGVIDGINSLLNSLSGREIIPSVHVLGKEAIPGVSLPNLGSIPHLATGLPYVPYDNFLAMLHKGERVVPAGQNRDSGGITLHVDHITINGGGSAETAMGDVAYGLLAAIKSRGGLPVGA